MKICPRCGAQNGDDFVVCTHCGSAFQAPLVYPAPKAKKQLKGWQAAVIVIAAVFGFGVIIFTIAAIGSLFGEHPAIDYGNVGFNSSAKPDPVKSSAEIKAEYIAGCESFDYKAIARNPDNYKGVQCVFTGKVIQVKESGKKVIFRINVTKDKLGLWDDTVYVEYTRTSDTEKRVLEDDIVKFYGELNGLKTYTTVLGSTLSIPMVNAKYIDPAESDSVDKPELSFGSTFTFDGLEITIGEGVKWVKVDNRFSDKDGSNVAELPITVKNISDESHGLNSFSYTFYGPDGTELDSVFSYFDNDVFSAGDMRPGASMQTYLHLLYTTEGDYYIEFDDYSDKYEVKIPLKK